MLATSTEPWLLGLRASGLGFRVREGSMKNSVIARVSGI